MKTMKIQMKCQSVIGGKKVPAKVEVSKGDFQPTVAEFEDTEARAAINRQHAKLASADQKTNYPVKSAK